MSHFFKFSMDALGLVCLFRREQSIIVLITALKQKQITNFPEKNNNPELRLFWSIKFTTLGSIRNKNAEKVLKNGG